MKKYEVLKEIYNPCAGKFIFDTSFPDEIESNNLEETLKSFLSVDFPEYKKEVFSDGTVIYILNLPLMERYSFSEV